MGIHLFAVDLVIAQRDHEKHGHYGIGRMNDIRPQLQLLSAIVARYRVC